MTDKSSTNSLYNHHGSYIMDSNPYLVNNVKLALSFCDRALNLNAHKYNIVEGVSTNIFRRT